MGKKGKVGGNDQAVTGARKGGNRGGANAAFKGKNKPNKNNGNEEEEEKLSRKERQRLQRLAGLSHSEALKVIVIVLFLHVSTTFHWHLVPRFRFIFINTN